MNLSSGRINRFQKNADVHEVGCNFSKLRTGIEFYAEPEEMAGAVCVVALETGRHSVMGCICSFTVTSASLLALDSPNTNE